MSGSAGGQELKQDVLAKTMGWQVLTSRQQGQISSDIPYTIDTVQTDSIILNSSY